MCIQVAVPPEWAEWIINHFPADKRKPPHSGGFLLSQVLGRTVITGSFSPRCWCSIAFPQFAGGA
jgi:hypothetical protein